jgi:hypothetical protein
VTRSVLVFASLAAMALVPCALSCSGQPVLSGAGEPLVVSGATFIVGDLPGSPPLADGGTPTSPAVTGIQSVNNAFRQGQAGASYSGDVTSDATSLAVRFPDAGTGYWVFVPGAPDLTDPGNDTWSMTFGIGEAAPTGLTTLRFAALDANGSSGTQVDQPVCIDSVIPDNFNACIPGRKPPNAVLSLAWDAPVDLDLWLVTPSGVTLSPKHPTTALASDAGVPASAGELDHDSDANCVVDTVSREDVVWKDAPQAGTYLAYADLFSACGQPSVRFTLSLYVAEPADGGDEQLVQVLQIPGEMLAVQANGGASAGLYVTSFTFPFPGQADGGT